MKSFKILLVTLLFVFAFISTGLTYTLEMKLYDGNGNEAGFFPTGNSLIVKIGINNAQDVAGCAFTLQYPSAVLNPPVIDTDGLSADIDSPFPFLFIKDLTSTKMYRGNDATGELFLSGAAINTSTGGGIEQNAVPDQFFTVIFTVKANALTGTYKFIIKQTELWNPQAGYGKDASGNNVPTTQTEMAAGDQKETVPVLVGAKSNGDTGYDNYSSVCEGMTGDCAFPILLGGPTTAFSNVEKSFYISGDVDTDDDDVLDGQEIVNGTDPTNPDSDRDGYSDGQEIINNTDPLVYDDNKTLPGYDAAYDRAVSNLDVDGNGDVGAYTDGLMLGRYVFEIRDNPGLIENAVAGDCNRCDYATILNYLSTVEESVLDIDGNGSLGSYTDGQLLMRYAWDIRDNPGLIKDAVATDCTRCTYQEIYDYLELIMPPSTP